MCAEMSRCALACPALPAYTSAYACVLKLIVSNDVETNPGPRYVFPDGSTLTPASRSQCSPQYNANNKSCVPNSISFVSYASMFKPDSIGEADLNAILDVSDNVYEQLRSQNKTTGGGLLSVSRFMTKYICMNQTGVYRLSLSSTAAWEE